MTASAVKILRPSAAASQEIAETLYFTSSGSYDLGGATYSGTGSNVDAFASVAIGYLSHVDDPWSVQAPGNPYVSWTAKVSQSKVASLFGIGHIRSLRVTERYAGGLVKSLTATSATGVTSTISRSSEGWRTSLGLPGAWVAGISGR